MSRDYPMLFGYLVLALGGPEAPDDLDVIMDRRRRGGDGERAAGERRGHPEIEQSLRVCGYAIVAPKNDPAALRNAQIASRALAGITMKPEQPETEGRWSRRRLAVAGATIGALAAGLAIMLSLSDGTVSAVAQAAAAAIEWARGSASRAETAGAPVPPAPPAPEERRTAALEPTAPPASAGPSAAAPPTAPASPAAGLAPLPRPGAAAAPGPATRADVVSPFSGLPRVEIASQVTGSGAKRTLAYTVRLSDTEGRPLTGADVWLRVAMPDHSDREARLTSGEPPGTYRGRLTVGARTPEVSRVRIAIGGTRVEVPVAQPR